MKIKCKKLLLLYLMFTSALLVGCVSNADYSNLETNYNDVSLLSSDLKTKNENLEKDKKILTAEKELLEFQLDKLSKENKNLKAENDEFKNGATNKLYKIKETFEAGDYYKVIILATDLHEKFNGSSEDIEGQALMVDSQKVIDEAIKAKEEAEKQAQLEKEKTVKEEIRSIIHVTKISNSSPNSAGGVNIYMGYLNMSEKIIKYATFTITPYNAVGDVVYSKIENKSTFRARDTGPYNQGEGLTDNSNKYWSCAWYSYQIDHLKLDQIVIEYMDGTITVISGENVEYAIY